MDALLVDGIGQRIRAARAQRQLTQRELGRKLGVSYQLVQCFERGRKEASLDHLMTIAAVLRVRRDWLLTGLGSPPVRYFDRRVGRVGGVAFSASGRRGRVSQRQAAKELGVNQATVSRDLMQDASKSDAKRVTKAERRAQPPSKIAARRVEPAPGGEFA